MGEVEEVVRFLYVIYWFEVFLRVGLIEDLGSELGGKEDWGRMKSDEWF